MNRAMTAALDMVGAALAKPGPDVATRVAAKRSREADGRMLTRLVEDVAAGIRVFNERGEAALTEIQIYERSRNIVTGLTGNYFIEGERT